MGWWQGNLISTTERHLSEITRTKEAGPVTSHALAKLMDMLRDCQLLPHFAIVHLQFTNLIAQLLDDSILIVDDVPHRFQFLLHVFLQRRDRFVEKFLPNGQLLLKGCDGLVEKFWRHGSVWAQRQRRMIVFDQTGSSWDSLQKKIKTKNQKKFISAED